MKDVRHAKNDRGLPRDDSVAQSQNPRESEIWGDVPGDCWQGL